MTKDLSIEGENELICEKLLGWHRPPPAPRGCYNTMDWLERRDTPYFTNWDEAGLILQSFDGKGLSVEVGNLVASWYCDLEGILPAPTADTGPLAVRAAALAYIRCQP